mgnify:CR=1 FL=1
MASPQVSIRMVPSKMSSKISSKMSLKQSKRQQKVQKPKVQSSIRMKVQNTHAAGIDIGGKFHMVCPRQGEVKKFGVVTRELHLLADYLKQEGIKTVAMESTGYHWKPLFLSSISAVLLLLLPLKINEGIHL